VLLNGAERGEAEGLPDLALGGRDPMAVAVISDKVEDFLLTFG
jgi:hypothetical protein